MISSAHRTVQVTNCDRAWHHLPVDRRQPRFPAVFIVLEQRHGLRPMIENDFDSHIQIDSEGLLTAQIVLSFISMRAQTRHL